MSYITDITKTTRKGNVEEFQIEIGLRDEMRHIIKGGIIYNLEAIKRFLDLGEDHKDICAGIYTYAVEEYGKILFLSGLNPTTPNNKIPILYTRDKQGFLNHRHKIDLALNALPSSCKLISRGSFSSESFSSKSFTQNTAADFEARKTIFYTDFDQNNKYCSVLNPSQVNRDVLMKAVDEFLQHIRIQNYP
jgi:AbiV family abortive infection protein